MTMNYHKTLTLFLSLLAGAIFFSSCKKNLPKERLSIANDSQYTQYVYQPVLGRSILFANVFQFGNSSRPLDFKIVNMRSFTNDDAPELTKNYPVLVWKEAYTGTEQSLQEIEAKRVVENHPLFEIRPHSGEFMMWASANSNMVRVQPDSGYVFEVEMSNSGGRKYFQNFKLRPFRECPYEPSNLDPITGQATSVTVSPTAVNIMGERGQPLNTRDVRILFKKAGNGNSLTFSAIDSLSNPIPLDKFATTDWKNLVHGFNITPALTAEGKVPAGTTQIKYDVAYPIPCTQRPTKYTTSTGAQARAVLKFERLGFGNILQQHTLTFNFNIYEKGDWEIIFWFANDRPKFDND